MIEIPVSPKIPAASWPRAGVPEYIFTVRSFGGQALGINLKEFDWTLQVDSRRSLLTVESFRSDADIPGQPIGLFRQVIDDQRLRDFEKLVTDSRLGELHPAMSTHPGYTERSYTMAEPQRPPIQVKINNSDEELNSRIAPLRSAINSMLATSFGHPERAVRLGITRSGMASGNVVELTITNHGIESVCFGDPRWLYSSGPLHRAALMVAEFPEIPPGESPALAWKEVPLEPLNPQPENEPLVILKSGETWKTQMSWKPPSGKRYLAYFTWANYTGEPMARGTYRIRGRADSPRLVIQP